MGYRGKVVEQARARLLRAEGWTLRDIATELGVSRSSVSVWVRDLPVPPRSRRPYHGPRKPHPAHIRKLEELERCRQDAEAEFASITHRELLVFGLALYLGEGFKTEGRGLGLANTSTEVLRFFVGWLRTCFDIDESRLRVRIYLHDDLDIEAATVHWSQALAIPTDQFTAPYRAAQRGAYRRSKHVFGCPSVRYADNLLHRRVMAMIEAITSRPPLPG
jgi:hypothetical protein